MFVALGETCRPMGMTLERWGWLTTLAYRRSFEEVPELLRKRPKFLLKFPKAVNFGLHMKDRTNEKLARLWNGGFETETQMPTEEFPVIYYIKACPLQKFAEEQGYSEYMPYLCNLDYVTFHFFGIPFYREKTCAAGDGVCDFKVKRNGTVNEAWPCHCLTEGDSLK